MNNSEISLDISREFFFFCPAVGSGLTLGYPRATITPPLFSLPWIRFPRDKGEKKYFGGALRAVKFGVSGTKFS